MGYEIIEKRDMVKRLAQQTVLAHTLHDHMPSQCHTVKKQRLRIARHAEIAFAYGEVVCGVLQEVSLWGLCKILVDALFAGSLARVMTDPLSTNPRSQCPIVLDSLGSFDQYYTGRHWKWRAPLPPRVT